MGCITRECPDCGHCDGNYPANPAKRTTCPKCGGRLVIEFDEYADHWDEREEDEE